MQTPVAPQGKGINTRLTELVGSVVPASLSPNAKIFLLGGLANGVSNGIFSSIMQLYLVTLGFSAQSLGSIFMYNSLSCTILSIPCGILADRYGKRKMVVASFIMLMASLGIFFTTSNIQYFRVAFILMGAGNACFTIFTPLYSSFFDKTDLDKAFGLYGLLNIMSMSLGNLAGYIPGRLVTLFLLTELQSYRYVMMGGSILFLFQYMFYLLSLRNHKDTLSEGFSFKLKSWKPVLKFSVLLLFGNIAGGMMFSLFPYYVHEKFGVASSGLGLLFFLSNMSMAVSKGAAAAVAKKLGNMRSVAIGLSLSAVFFLLMPLSPSFGLLSFFYILRMGTRFMSDPLLTGAFMRSISDDEQSTANSIRMISMNMGGAVSPWLGGTLMEKISLDTPALLGAGLTFILAILYPVLLKDELKESS